MTSNPKYSRITGTGSYLPPNRVSNEALAAQLAGEGIETSDQWIVERTGIQARHFAAADVTSSDLAFEAAGLTQTRRAFYRALADAGLGREAVVIAVKP